MLAILYILALLYFGDCLCRRFYRFRSAQHRFATAFLVGLLLSSWITYLGALDFAWTGHALLSGNLVFLAVVILTARFLPPRPASGYLDTATSRPSGTNRYDWLCLGAFFIFGGWLMLATLGFHNGNFEFGFKGWSDFGANLSLAQSFVLGNNFPSEHPFFPGVSLRYHFLFWFQTANLAYLGLNLVWSVNLLSILSLMALLILLMTFAEVLFNSRVVGRIAAALFFFASSSLAYIPFLRKQESVAGALRAIVKMTQFLNTGFPYRGEDWGALTVDVFANQRHLISGTGLLFVALVYLIDRYQHQTEASLPAGENSLAPHSIAPELTTEGEVLPENSVRPDDREIRPDHNKQKVKLSFSRGDVGALLFTGALIGLLPYWNSAVFVAAMLVSGSIWLLFPYRLYLSCLVGMAVLVGLPQILLLKSGNLAQTGETIFHFGYTIQNPTLSLVLQYLAWTFGFKWILLFIALWLLSATQRRLFLAVSILLPVVFLLKLSTDVFNNHKLLNIWNIFATTYVAYGLWRIGKASTQRAVLAAALTLLMIFGAIIELFPIHNDLAMTVPFGNDRLTNWLLQNTRPSDIFLTQNLLAHPILFTGRRIFLGYPLFAWTAGYNVSEREAAYARMFAERNPMALLRLLQENKIAYVGIDDGVRHNHLVKDLNEVVYQQNFQKVFEDTEHKYDNLTLYQIRN